MPEMRQMTRCHKAIPAVVSRSTQHQHTERPSALGGQGLELLVNCGRDGEAGQLHELIDGKSR